MTAATNAAEPFPPPKPGVTLKDEWSTFPLYDQVDIAVKQFDQVMMKFEPAVKVKGILREENCHVYITF